MKPYKEKINIKKLYTKRQIVASINYWKKQIRLGNYLKESGRPSRGRRLAESAGGYKWLLTYESHITEGQLLGSYDSEIEALNDGWHEIEIVANESLDTFYKDPRFTKEFSSVDELKSWWFNHASNGVHEMLRMTTDANDICRVFKVKEDSLPDIIDIVESEIGDEAKIEWVGTNIRTWPEDDGHPGADGLFRFGNWEAIYRLKI